MAYLVSSKDEIARTPKESFGFWLTKKMATFLELSKLPSQFLPLLLLLPCKSHCRTGEQLMWLFPGEFGVFSVAVGVSPQVYLHC